MALPALDKCRWWCAELHPSLLKKMAFFYQHQDCGRWLTVAHWTCYNYFCILQIWHFTQGHLTFGLNAFTVGWNDNTFEFPEFEVFLDLSEAHHNPSFHASLHGVLLVQAVLEAYQLLQQCCHTFVHVFAQHLGAIADNTICVNCLTINSWWLTQLIVYVVKHESLTLWTFCCGFWVWWLGKKQMVTQRFVAPLLSPALHTLSPLDSHHLKPTDLLLDFQLHLRVRNIVTTIIQGSSTLTDLRAHL